MNYYKTPFVILHNYLCGNPSKPNNRCIICHESVPDASWKVCDPICEGRYAATAYVVKEEVVLIDKTGYLFIKEKEEIK